MAAFSSSLEDGLDGFTEVATGPFSGSPAISAKGLGSATMLRGLLAATGFFFRRPWRRKTP